MERLLEENLQDIAWPRETLRSLEIAEQGQHIRRDVDLPELEDMPSKIAAVPARGLKLSVKDLPAAQIRKRYMAHVHGIGFRIVGESFAALPSAQRSEEHTSELQSLMRISYAVFCLKNKTSNYTRNTPRQLCSTPFTTHIHTQTHTHH